MSDQRPSDNGVSRRALLLVSLLAACTSGDPSKPGSQTPRAPAPTGPLPTLVDAVGDDALLVVWWAPSKLGELRAALEPVLAGLPAELRREVDAMVAHGATPALLGALSGRTLPPLTGLDDSRPVVVALGIAPRDPPLGALSRSVVDGKPPVIRHRLLLPATDVAQARASVEAAARKVRRFQVGVFAGADHVRVELAVGGAPQAEAPKVVARDTSARRALLADDAVAGVWLRGWRLRDFATAFGAMQATEALAHASADVTHRIRAAAMSILLRAEVLLVDEGVEIDDLALVLRAAPGVIDVEGVASLTPDGARVFAAAAGQVPAAPKTPALATLTLGANVRAALDVAREPPGLRGATKLRDVSYQLAECGAACTTHFGLRQPAGLAKLVERLGGPEATVPALAGVRAALLNVDGDTPTIAVVADASAAAVERLRPLVAAVRGELFVVPAGERHTVYAGWGTDPRAFFADAGKPAAAPLLQLRVDGGKRPAGLPIPDALRGLELRVDATERALVTRVRIDVGSAKPLGAPTRYAGSTASPVGVRADSAGAVCLRRYARAVAELFHGLGEVPPDKRDLLARSGLAKADGDLACAAKDPATKPPAHALRRALLVLLADFAAASWTPATSALEWGCAQGDAVVCARLKTLQARPRLALPTVEPPADVVRDLDRGPRVVVTAAGATVNDRPLAEHGGVTSRPMVAANADVDTAKVLAALRGLRTTGTERATLLVETAGGRQGLSVQLVAAPPKANFARIRLTATGAQVSVESDLPRKADDARVATLRAEFPDYDLVLGADPGVPWGRFVKAVAAASPRVMLR